MNKAQETSGQNYYRLWVNPQLRTDIFNLLYSLVRVPEQDQENATTLLGFYLEQNQKKEANEDLTLCLFHLGLEEVNNFCIQALFNTYMNKKYIDSVLSSSSEWITTHCKCPEQVKKSRGICPLMVLGVKQESVKIREMFELLLRKGSRFDKTIMANQSMGIQAWAKTTYNKQVANERAKKIEKYEKELKEEDPEFPQDTSVPGISSSSISMSPAPARTCGGGYE